MSLAGLRTALPTRSVTTSAHATQSNPVYPSNGTDSTLSAYPAMVHAQKRCVRSASGPENRRSASAAASPTPVTMPISAADAPSAARNGPVTERAPSYTTSAHRLTAPKPKTNRHAPSGGRTVESRIGASACRSAPIMPLTRGSR